MAAGDLQRAAVVAKQCTGLHGNLHSAWKLRGDIALQQGAITPPSASPADEPPEFRWVALCLFLSSDVKRNLLVVIHINVH